MVELTQVASERLLHATAIWVVIVRQRHYLQSDFQMRILKDSFYRQISSRSLEYFRCYLLWSRKYSNEHEPRKASDVTRRYHSSIFRLETLFLN